MLFPMAVNASSNSLFEMLVALAVADFSRSVAGREFEDEEAEVEEEEAVLLEAGLRAVGWTRKALKVAWLGLNLIELKLLCLAVEAR